MNTSISSYKRHRFPSEIIQYAVWLYYRFNVSHRNIEDLLAERGTTFSPPTGWKKGSSEYPQVIDIFTNPAGHTITVIDSGLPEYVCDNYKVELQTTQGVQETGKATGHGQPVIWFKSTAHNPVANIRVTSVHYCFNTSRGAVILGGYAPVKTFFRSEIIFRKSAASMTLRNR